MTSRMTPSKENKNLMGFPRCGNAKIRRQCLSSSRNTPQVEARYEHVVALCQGARQSRATDFCRRGRSVISRAQPRQSRCAVLATRLNKKSGNPMSEVVNNRPHQRFELEVEGHVAKSFY